MKRVLALLLVFASSPAFGRGDLEIVANDGVTGAPIGFERSSVRLHAGMRAFVFFFGEERTPARATCGKSTRFLALGRRGRLYPAYTGGGDWRRDLVDQVCAVDID